MRQLSGKHTAQAERIEAVIHKYLDFPKKGVAFYDLTPALETQLDTITRILRDQIKTLGIDYIAGIESRGFIVGAALAQRMGIGFVPIRKAGKLPGRTISQKYSLEYGSAEIEAQIYPHKSRRPNIAIVDDVVATGGTILAAEELMTRAGYSPVAILCVVNIPGLNSLATRENFYSIIES